MLIKDVNIPLGKKWISSLILYNIIVELPLLDRKVANGMRIIKNKAMNKNTEIRTSFVFHERLLTYSFLLEENEHTRTDNY